MTKTTKTIVTNRHICHSFCHTQHIHNKYLKRKRDNMTTKYRKLIKSRARKKPSNDCTLPPIPSRFFPQTVTLHRESFPNASWKLSHFIGKTFMTQRENCHASLGKLSWRSGKTFLVMWASSHIVFWAWSKKNAVQICIVGEMYLFLQKEIKRHYTARWKEAAM